MAQRTIIQYTTGTPGTGKSYLRCPYFLIKEFLPDSEGVHYSNFPIGPVNKDHRDPPRFEGETFAERIADEVAKRTGRDPADFIDRMQVIPKDELKKWETGESGPWEFFKGKSLAGVHIAIDECHNFIGRKHHKQHREKWQAWLGEIRHQGATVEFLSQSHMKVAKEVGYESALRRTLESTEDLRPPLIGIPLKEFYNIKAKFTGKYTRATIITERVENNERWDVNYRETIILNPFFYQFYNSFNKPQQGGESGKLEKEDWQKYSLIRLLLRLPKKYPIVFATRGAVLAVLIFFMMGGMGNVVRYIVRAFSQGVTVATTSEIAPEDAAIEPVANGIDLDAPLPRPDTYEMIDIQPQPQPQTPATEGDHAQRTKEREELEQVYKQLEAMHEKVQRYRVKEQEATAVVLITRDSATMRDGYTYNIGETIDYGYYNGRTITRVDYRRRAVHLDDGVVLRLGRVPTTEADHPASDVPGAVQPAEGEDAHGEQDHEAGSKADALGP